MAPSAVRRTAVKAKAVDPTIFSVTQDSSSAASAAGIPPRPPTGQPLPFSLKDIRAVIPAHCFERSALISGAYLARDFAMLATLVLGVSWADATLSPTLRALAWVVYWLVSGQVATGVWILGHEAGHGAFSSSKALNDVVGWVLHSALLLPYASWRISHSHHHAATNSMEDDAVFVPRTRTEALGVGVSAQDAAARRALPPRVWAAITTAIYVLFGWTTYLLVDFPGPAKHAGASHYNPASALFTPDQRMDVAVSVAGVALAWAAVAASVLRWGLFPVVAYYGIPIAVVYGNLVVLTLLQHTDVHVPHFRGPAFSWLAGALCTVDRTYGLGIDTLWHRISDTHVVHHLFSTMPFYHAAEATDALVKSGILGSYYLRDPTPVPVALWRAMRHCQWVEDKGGVVFYKGLSGADADADAAAAAARSE